MTDEAQKLRVVLQAAYDRRADVARVRTSWLATEAMRDLDPSGISPALVYQAAHLQLRQLARLVCRGRFEQDGGEQETHDLFPNLQTRYPAAHSDDAEPEYVLLEHLTDGDVQFNISRLRREAASKLRHADALEAWWQNRMPAAAE